MNQAVINGMVKASMMKEALASCQIEGIGLDLTLEDLYLAELGHYKSRDKEKQVKEVLSKNTKESGQ